MPKHKPQIIQAFNRPGEGETLTIVERKNVSKDGLHGTSLSIDLGTAPVPERKYLADVVSVVQVDEFTHILFGQPKTVGDGLRTMVDVELPPETILRLLASNADLEAVRRAGKIPTGKLVAFKEEPAQSIGLSANIIAASCSGVEACIDFYKTSAFVMANLAKGGDFRVEPVVRVSLPTRVLFAMFEEFQKLEPSLRKMSTEEPK